jgi:IS5 family transposase
MEKYKEPSLADSICDLRKRKVKSAFFLQMNELLDWNLVKKEIDKFYTPKQRSTGQPAYSGLILFKMSLLQTWYGLSDYEVEDRVNDSISFSQFLGMNIEDTAPDHSTLSRFRTRMTKANAYEPLLQEINRQLEEAGVIVKSGALVDASIIDTPLKPKGKAKYVLDQDSEKDREDTNTSEEKSAAATGEKTAESSQTPENASTEKEGQKSDKQEDASEAEKGERELASSVDKDGAWVKKGGKVRFGFKKHHITDEEGIILDLLTTPANIHETNTLEELLAKANLPEGVAVKADKGYASKKNSELLKERKLRDHILKKAKKGKGLTTWEKKFNKLVGKVRYKVERSFGSIKRWFGGGVARYKGLEKMHTQNILEAIGHNLYRSPRIIASKAQ